MIQTPLPKWPDKPTGIQLPRPPSAVDTFWEDDLPLATPTWRRFTAWLRSLRRASPQ